MDKFCSTLREGENLKVLNKAKQWFSERGIDIVKYLYCNDNPSRNKESLDDSDLNNCEICGKELYRIDENSRYASNKYESIKIVQKKHLVFVDNCGKKHYTCYGLNRCFKRVNYEFGEVGSECPKYEAPGFYDLCFEGSSNDISRDEVGELVEKKYSEIVVEFLEKWFPRPINKSNVLDFMSEFGHLEQEFLYKHFGSKDCKRIRNKIFKIIGVKR